MTDEDERRLEMRLAEASRATSRLITSRDAWQSRAEQAEQALAGARAQLADLQGYAVRCSRQACAGILRIATSATLEPTIRGRAALMLGALAISSGWLLGATTAVALGVAPRAGGDRDFCPACAVNRPPY